MNPNLLALTPVGARRLLEIGCGDGAFAQAYRARSPATRYVAVEQPGVAADAAEPKVDRLLRGDVVALDEAELTEGCFDVIVAGNAFGRGGDVGALLARIARLLTPEGHLVLDFPNVTHWTSLSRLVAGGWSPGDPLPYGYQTIDTARALLERAGLRMIRARPGRTAMDGDAARAALPALADVAGRMGIDGAAFAQEAGTLHYTLVVDRAERREPRPMRIDVCAFAPVMLEARTHLPATYLGSLPELTVHYREKEASLANLPVDAPKLLILQRFQVADQEKWLRFLARAIRGGWLIAIEYDDHPDLVAKVNKRSETTSHWATFEQVHAVQTSTPALAEAMRAHNPEVRAFANAAFTLPAFTPRPMRPARMFFGALNREGFSGSVARSLAPAIARHPDAFFDVVHDRAFFEGLPTANKSFRPMMRYADYLEAMGACDIVLAPLEGAPGEMFKSDIKYVEAASRGVAMIASPPVYAATIRDGETGLIARQVADWSPALDRLLSDPALRDHIARTAWEDVRDHRMFAGQAHVRRDWYWDLWARREALNASLIARVPGLAAALA